MRRHAENKREMRSIVSHLLCCASHFASAVHAMRPPSFLASRASRPILWRLASAVRRCLCATKSSLLYGISKDR